MMVIVDRVAGARRALLDFGVDGQLGHVPGLDGLRGIAVIGVVCFHGGFSQVSGGYLGVSLFFTLSGFLITSLLLAERSATGSISLRAFWVRRFRRLLPAAWLTLAAVLMVVWFWGTTSQARSVRWDVPAALAQVANWRFLLGGQSYGALFDSPSPVLHFWSLAIEEQVYLILPVLVAGVLAMRRSSGRVLAVVLAVAASLSWGLPLILRASGDRIYYGTDTRAGEMLAGSLLAVVISRPGVREVLARKWTAGTGVAVLAAVAALATGWLWATREDPASFAGSGGLVLHSGLAVALILGVLVPSGPVNRLCGTAPLRWVGRISYGIYLFHWPLLVFLDRDRTGLARAPRFALVMAITLALAVASARWVELPIRAARLRIAGVRVRPLTVAPLLAIAILGGSMAVDSSGRVDQRFDVASAQEQLDAMTASGRPSTTLVPVGQPSPGATPTTVVAQPPPPRFSLYGDSVALSLALLFASWSQQGAPAAWVNGITDFGCGLTVGGDRRFEGVEALRAECDAWPVTWPSAAANESLDVVLIHSAQWELVDRRLPGDSTWRSVGDPVFDEALRTAMTNATDLMSASGAVVLWVNQPSFSDRLREQGTSAQQRSHTQARVDRYNQILAEVVATRPDSARLIDLAAWMEPRRNDVAVRADGSHFVFSPQNPVVSEFLGPEVLRLWGEVWRSRPAPGQS